MCRFLTGQGIRTSSGSFWIARAGGRTAWVLTRCGHQNQRPNSAAMDGVMNDRITSVSNNRPIAMVVPTWAMTRRSLTAMVAMVKRTPDPRT